MILMNDFKAEPDDIRAAMLRASKRVLDSGWYVLGKEVENFEAAWAKRCGVAHGVGVGNGMDAIEIALRALDIGPGDEVITTSMTAFATALAIVRAGAIPVLADIELDTALLSIESARRCITERTKAVILVHLYGQIRDMDAWSKFCDDQNIILIEDCAQAHLANLRGRFSGAFGRVGAYSFYPTKNLGAPGDGGMLVTNEQPIAEKSARLRNYGQSVRYQHPELGMNSRLDEIHAAMLYERLAWLEEFTQRRREIAAAYHIGIQNPSVKMMSLPQEQTAHVYHLFVVLCEARDQLQAHLDAIGVQALIHYPIPIHHQQPCLEWGRDPQGLRNSDRHADICLSLPCHPQMTNADIEIVIKAVNTFKA